MAHYRTRMARGERGVVVPVTKPRRRSLTTAQRNRIGASRLGIAPDEYQQHVDNGERWCSPHQRWDRAQDFVSDRTAPDGLGGMCKAANREYVAKRRRAS